MTETYLAALLAGASVLCMMVGWYALPPRSRVSQRLAILVAPVSAPLPPPSLGVRPSFRQRTLAPLAHHVGQAVANGLPDRQLERLRRNLILAGLPARRHLSYFLAARSASAVAGGALLLLASLRQETNPAAALLATALGAGAGFLLPGIWLGGRIARRRRQVLKGLPDALDLLSISVGAGLGFDGALQEVLGRWKNALTEELAIAQRDMRLGKSRRAALRELTERTDVPEVAQFAAAVIQAEQLGAPLRETLLVQAEQIRLAQRHRAEEQARKAAVKMMLPAGLCIFPALLIVLIGPAIPSLQAYFK
jgi:tight adherence protein C